MYNPIRHGNIQITNLWSQLKIVQSKVYIMHLYLKAPPVLIQLVPLSKMNHQVRPDHPHPKNGGLLDHMTYRNQMWIECWIKNIYSFKSWLDPGCNSWTFNFKILIYQKMPLPYCYHMSGWHQQIWWKQI